jgi:hypothetical protein
MGNTDCYQSNGQLHPYVSGGTPPYSYQWTGPNGYISNDSLPNHLAAGKYLVTITDQSGAMVMGAFQVWHNPTGFVVSLEQITPSYCGKPSGCLKVTALGSTPPFTYHWSNGSTSSQNCGLMAGSYTVTVINATGCSEIQTYNIPDSQTEFNLNVVSTAISSCGETGALVAVPSAVGIGNPGPYQYLWSTGGTNAAISNLPANVYTVTVTSVHGCTKVESGEVQDLSTAQWTFELDPACLSLDTTVGNLTLRCSNYSNMTFPVTVTWSNGTTHVIPTKPVSDTLDAVLSVPTGLYAATVASEGGCQKTIQTALVCQTQLSLPPGSCSAAFYIKDEYLSPQLTADSCAGIYAKDFDNLKSIQFNLYIPFQTEFTGFRNSVLPGLTSGNFAVDNTLQALSFIWNAPGVNGVTFLPDTKLFDVCFKPNNNAQHADLYFRNTPYPSNVRTGDNRDLGFIGLNGYVLFGLYAPPGPSVCEFCLTPANCASDGNQTLYLSKCDINDDWTATIALENGTPFANINGPMFLDSSAYEVTVIQPGKMPNRLLVNVPFRHDSVPCVWPGDADNNNAVNHHDLLYIGLGYGKNGPSRPGASLDWSGQSSPDWSQQTANRHINFKNIDTNGDGVINAADTVAIVQNWGNVVDPARDDPFAAPADFGPIGGLPQLLINKDTVAPGEAVTLPVLLGSNQTPLDSLYGLAFSIAYDPSLIKSNLYFKPSASWFGDPANLLWLQRDFHTQGRIDIAVTRTDGMPMSGNGRIGDLFIVIEDNIFLKSGDHNAEFLHPVDTVRKTTLFFRGLHPVSNIGKAQQLEGPSTEIVIRKGTVSTTIPDDGWKQSVRVAPNPASGMVFVSSPGADIERITVSDLSGRILLAQQPAVSGSDASFSVRGAPAGMYVVQIMTAEGIHEHKLVVMH